jgi:uncharacterized protein
MRIPIVLLAGLLLVTLAGVTASAQEAAPRTLGVSATDTVRIVPDRAIVRFAIVTRAQDPEAARQQNEQASQRVLNAVRERGIPERQIQLRTLRLSEEVEHRQGRRVRIGFIARRDFEVIIDEMDRLPAVVARVVQEGATEFGGISYDIRDRRTPENEALRRAAVRAREKAEILAAALGTSIRGVHRVSEAGVYMPAPPPYPYAERAMAMDVVATHEAYAPGEMEVRATISVVFELH